MCVPGGSWWSDPRAPGRERFPDYVSPETQVCGTPSWSSLDSDLLYISLESLSSTSNALFYVQRRTCGTDHSGSTHITPVVMSHRYVMHTGWVQLSSSLKPCDNTGTERLCATAPSFLVPTNTALHPLQVAHHPSEAGVEGRTLSSLWDNVMPMTWRVRMTSTLRV